jgi:hypothetical protein
MVDFAKKRLQVFVSSTFIDLRDERQAAVEAILSAGHIPAGMELFAAGDESQMEVIKGWIDQSDVYLLILGGRYGSIEPKTGKSYVELEYEYALSKGKPSFACVIHKDALNEKLQRDGESVIESEHCKKLEDFRALVLTKISKFFNDRRDIKITIAEALANFARRRQLRGWVRSTPQTSYTLAVAVFLLLSTIFLIVQKSSLVFLSHKPIIVPNSFIREKVEKQFDDLDTNMSKGELSFSSGNGKDPTDNATSAMKQTHEGHVFAIDHGLPLSMWIAAVNSEKNRGCNEERKNSPYLNANISAINSGVKIFRVFIRDDSLQCPLLDEIIRFQATKGVCTKEVKAIDVQRALNMGPAQYWNSYQGGVLFESMNIVFIEDNPENRGIQTLHWESHFLNDWTDRVRNLKDKVSGTERPENCWKKFPEKK